MNEFYKKRIDSQQIVATIPSAKVRTSSTIALEIGKFLIVGYGGLLHMVV